MTRITYAFLAVFALALVMVAIGNTPTGSVPVWTGYGVQANILAATVAVGAHLVMASLIYRLWQGVGLGSAGRQPKVQGPSVDALRALSPDEESDVSLIGLRGLTARAAERGDVGTARELARQGLANKPGTGWLEELLDDPIAPSLKA